MTGHEIRSKYLEFFASKGHKIVPSDSLVPKDDPTVLFTTAGMQQFKPQFMGHLTGFSRAASSQKCLRTDDLTEVGVTDFHHTMFEMLGNFSFGDYFKREAILWAWEFLTKVMGIPAEKLWVSVHQEDQEAYGIWLNEVKLPPDRIVKLGDKSNFWPSNARLNGPNGPCGPCSEIFFDWGVDVGCQKPGCDPDCSCGRFCEVWNLVFTQYNRQEGGVLEPLPAKNIDTGMGLERLTAVMQGKRNNFESDLFQPIIQAVEKLLAGEGAVISLREKRVMADHIRAVTFGLADGVPPSNEGRGYVMRRLIVDMTNIFLQAGIKKPLVNTLVPAVVSVMKGPYPELVVREKDIMADVRRVEEAVIKLNAEKIPEIIKKLKNAPKDPVVIGQIIFEARDAHGLAWDTVRALTADTLGAALTSAAVPLAEALMKQGQERSRAGSKMQGDVFLSNDVDVKGIPPTVFIGHDQPSDDVKVVAIFVAGQKVAEAREGDKAAVILDRTPFYAEQGGQVADRGLLRSKTGRMDVKDVQKVNDVFVHRGVVQGQIRSDEFIKASIDGERRMAVMRNHTSTHLLQAALRQVLGVHVKQQGSSVDETRMRFDFTHPQAVSKQELVDIEDIVNSFVRRCDQVSKKVLPLEEARQSGALAFFAEKYGETVRVVSVGDYSREFCGGTHLDNTGQIGLFKVLSEGAVAQGIRRIEAVTGVGALDLVRGREYMLERSAEMLKASIDDVPVRIEQQVKRIKELQKEVADFRFEIIKGSLSGIIDQAERLGDVTYVAHAFLDVDMETLRRVSDLIRQKCPQVVMLLAATTQEDGAVIISLSEGLVKKGMNAGQLIKKIASLFGGSGGGRPHMAQAGCRDPRRLKDVFAEIKAIVKESIRS